MCVWGGGGDRLAHCAAKHAAEPEQHGGGQDQPPPQQRRRQRRFLRPSRLGSERYFFSAETTAGDHRQLAMAPPDVGKPRRDSPENQFAPP